MTEYYAIFYQNYFSTIPFEKVKILTGITKREDVTTFSNVDFGVDTKAQGLNERNRVEIIEVNKDSQETIFEGVISFMSFSIERIFISAVDGKGLLMEKVFISPIRFHDDVNKLDCVITSSTSELYDVGSRILCLASNEIAECIAVTEDTTETSTIYRFKWKYDTQDKFGFVYATSEDKTYKYDGSTRVEFTEGKGITIQQYMDHYIQTMNDDFTEQRTHDVTIQDKVQQTSLVGDVYYDALNTLASEYQWKVSNGKISISELYGEDRSTELKLKYDGSFSLGNNIQNLTLETNSAFRNILVQTDDNTTTVEVDSELIALYGGIGKTIRGRDKNTESTANILASLSGSKRISKFDIVEGSISDLNAGDKIPLVISNTNDYMNFDSDVYVVSKITKISENTKSFSYQIADVIVARSGFKDMYTQVNSDLSLVKLQ